jgi:hypothetical protein
MAWFKHGTDQGRHEMAPGDQTVPADFFADPLVFTNLSLSRPSDLSDKSSNSIEQSPKMWAANWKRSAIGQYAGGGS